MSRVSGLTERIRLLILRGELPAGRLVLEVEQADRFDVSRFDVREALRHLRADGLLLGRDGELRVLVVDPAGLAELVQVRAALEALGAGLVAGHVRDGTVGPADLDRLAPAVARAAEAGDDPMRAVLADRDLHRALDALAGNALSHATLRTVWDRLVLAAQQGVLRPQRAGDAGDHDELLAAIREADAERAAAVARRHVLTLLD